MYDSLDADAHNSCIEDANDAGILVVCLLACTLRGRQDATIALDFEADGRIIGEWMANAVAPDGNVAFIEGLPGDQAAVAIGEGSWRPSRRAVRTASWSPARSAAPTVTRPSP